MTTITIDGVDVTTHMSGQDFYTIDPAVIEQVQPRQILNGYGRGPVTFREYQERAIEYLGRYVSYAAAVLDEHVPGWAARITEPLVMGSVTGCVLGQVFKDRPRGRMGFAKDDGHTCGYGRGIDFLAVRGYDGPPGVFSSEVAVPFWKAEIERRSQ